MLTHSLKPKAIAFSIHLSVTFLIGAITSSYVFFVLYPGDFYWVASGLDLYLIMLGVELVLGPVMSLVVYSSKKSRRQLILDYMVIGIVQLSALSYGMYSTFLARPVYDVFVIDRIEQVRALDLEQVDLDEAPEAFRKLSLFGPKFICVERPTDVEDKNDLLFSGVFGKDIQFFPKYYRACLPGEIEKRMGRASSLLPLLSQNHLERLEKLGIKDDDFLWLPTSSRFGRYIKIYAENLDSKWIYLDFDYYLGVMSLQ